MEIVAILLILGSIIGFGITAFKLLLNAIKRKPLKKNVVVLWVMVVMLFIGVSVMPTTPIDDADLVEGNTTEAPTKIPTETQSIEIGVRDESLEGRGRSDSGRSEPQYVGIIGYATNWGESYSDNEEYLSGSWLVPVYQKD